MSTCHFCHQQLASRALSCRNCPLEVFYMTGLIGWVIAPYDGASYQVIWVFGRDGRAIKLSICLKGNIKLELTENVEGITPSNIVSKLPTILVFS